MSTLADFRTNIKNITGNQKLTAEKMDWAINRAYDWCKNQLNQLYEGNLWITTSTITILPAVQNYDLPDDFVSLKAITDSDGKPVPRMSMNEPGELYNNVNVHIAQNVLRRYFVTGYNTNTNRQTVILYPKPTGTETYKIWYYFNPPALTNTTDSPLFLSSYHEVIDLYSSGVIYEAQQDAPAANQMFNRAKDMMNEMIGHLNERDASSNIRVVRSERYNEEDIIF